ncbi:MAG: polysaccharide deacetylase, partial [Proteobacteria bacterium]|nr:polysaccharide deacetylase [Pseudomonadota bacterium]
IETIRDLTGKPPRGYRSPSWDLSPHTVDLLLEHGFDYDSSMMGDDYTPYFARRGDEISLQQPARFGPPTRLLELPISWSLDDFPLFEYLRHQGGVQQTSLPTDAILRNWIDDYLYMKRSQDWGVITYTFHPFVIGRGHRMMLLERLIDLLAEGSAEFMTSGEAADAFLARTARDS